ncbi:MAG: CC_3452 family protein, partial [Caulobacteraceae bacterium]
MKLSIFAPALVLSAALFGSASAQPGAPAAEARLKVAVSAPVEKIFDGRIWRCENDVCLGTKTTRSQPPVRECARAARELGAFTSFRSGA